MVSRQMSEHESAVSSPRFVVSVREGRGQKGEKKNERGGRATVGLGVGLGRDR